MTERNPTQNPTEDATGGSKRPQVVIIGGGFGGLRVARSLGSAPVDITVIDRDNHHLFQPLLYQVATAGLSPADISVPIRHALNKQKNTTVILGEVTSVDPDAQRVELADGHALPYDHLVVAAGARTTYFGNEAWRDHALGLKDVRDGLAIRERFLLAFEAAELEENPETRRRLLTFVVVGGGPTGVEMAGALAELGRMVLSRDYRRISPDDIRVVLVEMMDRVLPPFAAKLSASAEKQLEELGVEVWLEKKVTNVDDTGIEVDGEHTTASIVVWAPGVEPVSLASRIGAETDKKGRIVVDDFCNVPGRSNLFAIGDIAACIPKDVRDEEGDEASPLPALAAVAQQQGDYVAQTIQGDLAGKTRAPFRYKDKGIMATVGRSRAVAQRGGMRLSGFIAWLAWIFVHIMLLAGFRNRVAVFFNWFWQYITSKRGARLITRANAPEEAERLEQLSAGSTPEDRAA